MLTRAQKEEQVAELAGVVVHDGLEPGLYVAVDVLVADALAAAVGAALALAPLAAAPSVEGMLSGRPMFRALLAILRLMVVIGKQPIHPPMLAMTHVAQETASITTITTLVKDHLPPSLMLM